MVRSSSVAVVVMMVAAGFSALALAPTASADATFFNARIRTHDSQFLDSTVFVPAGATTNSTPFILMTHGWGGSRIATPTGRVAEYLAAGYGVLTWDSRGFGQSTGTVELDSPDFEARDVSDIVTWLTNNVAQAKLQSRHDPLVGMSGGSYAGGVQLLAAAQDPRIDAIAPEITWNDLTEALAPNGVPKLAWTSALFGDGLATSCQHGAGPTPLDNGVTTGCTDPALAQWFAEVHATGGVPADVKAALDFRSPKNYNANIHIPTLLIQGFPDTLFNVDQAVANYQQIKATGSPVKLWIYDGGHALPGFPVPDTQASLIGGVVVNWMDRYLKANTSVDTGAEIFYYVDGAWQTGSGWPLAGTPENTHLQGLPTLMQGPVTGGTPAEFDWPLASGPVRTIGPAHVSFDVNGEGTDAFLFLSLAIDDGSGTLTRIDGQVQPVRAPLTLGASTHVETDLIDVGASVPAGSKLVIVLGTSEPMYDNNRVPGLVNVLHYNVDWTSQ